MDTVILDGVTYVKASAAAKDFKYTADYIGQLCRAKKIDAKLVGRTWFVNPDSIVSHKKAKFSTVKPDRAVSEVRELELEQSSGIALKTKVERAKVEPYIRNKTMKGLAEQAAKISESSAERKVRVSYEPDEENLMPTLTRKSYQPAKMIHVEPAGAKKLKVLGARKDVSFVPNELPDVALSGKLSIGSYATSEDLEQEPEVLPKASVAAVSGETKDSVVRSERESVKVSPETKVGVKNVEKKSVVVPAEALEAEVSDASGALVPSFVPSAVKGPVVEPKVSLLTSFSPLISTLFAALVIAVMFAASAQIFVTKTSYESGVVLQTANFLSLLKR